MDSGPDRPPKAGQRKGDPGQRSVIPKQHDDGSPPTPDALGRVEERWHAPALFSDWLARQMADPAKGISAEVSFRPDGILVFLYSASGRRVPLFLVVGKRGAKGEPSRFGTLLIPVPCPVELSQQLLTHTRQRLEEVFPQEPPTWMRRRALGVQKVGWGATFLEEFCYDLLLPGVTQWGQCLFQSDRFDPRSGLELTFSGAPGFRLNLVPSHLPSVGTWMGQYGPFTLTLADPSLAKHPFVNYVGYALSLLVPPKAKILSFDENAGDWLRNIGDPISQDAFLINGFRSCEENARALFGSKGRIIWACNLDRECMTYPGWHTGPTEGTNLNLWNIQTSADFIRTTRSTDLHDEEVITADGERDVSRIAEQVLVTSPDLVVVQGGCISQLMGENSRRSLDAALVRAGADTPTLAFDVSLEHDGDYLQLWDDLIDQTKPESPTVRPNSINLVGYGHERTPGISELLELLGAVGISDVQLVLPTFDMAQIRGFTQAAATLIYPSPHVIRSFSRARRHCVTNLLFPAAPWGVAGTISWLNTVLESVGRPPLTASLQQELTQRFLPASWAKLLLEPTDDHLGFISSAAYAKQDGSEVRHGVPIPSLLAEMGFALDLVLLPPRQGYAMRLPEDVYARWGIQEDGQSRNQLIVGQPGETLGELVRRARPSAFYTEWEGDERLLRQGKYGFSFSDLRMGLAGAAHNLAQLRRLARLPFSARYALYCSERPPHG